MSKAAIYMLPRTSRRVGPSEHAIAWDHFTSTRAIAASPTVAADIVNNAIERGWLFTVKDNRDGTVTVTRA